MPPNPTTEEKIAQLKNENELLTKQLDLLKAQTAIDIAKKNQEAEIAKARADALKDQIVAQSAFSAAQAELPFAELQGIKAGINGLTLPSGNEGTVSISAGADKTALLRSKQPMLKLLDEVANTLVAMCPNGAVLVTEAQLEQAYAATFTLKRICDEKDKLDGAIKKISPQAALLPALPAVSAGVYTLGFVLDTINSLSKLLRTNHQLNVFSADEEAMQMLGYLLDSKKGGFVVKPAMLDDRAIIEADKLLEVLRDLGIQIQVGNDTLERVAKLPEDQKPIAAEISSLKAQIDAATLLIDALHPAKKPEAFWAQVIAQVLATNIRKKQRLLIEAKAQVVQDTVSKWYWFKGDRIFVTGEVQVAYRLLNRDGSLAKAGVILNASKSDSAKIEQQNAITWSVRSS